MHTEVKLGIVMSLVVVVGAGWYYMRRPPNAEIVPLGNEPIEQDVADAADSTTLTASADRQADSSTLALPTDSFPQSTASSNLELAPSDVGSTASAPMEDVLALSGEAPPTEDSAPENPLAALLANNLEDQAATPESADSIAELTEAVTPLDAPTRDAEPPADTVTRTFRRTPPIDRAVAKRDTPPKRSGKVRPGTRTHTVQKGDTLAILAEIYYGSQRLTNLLLDANPGLNPKRMMVGTVLNVPPAGSVTPAPAKPARSALPGAGRSYTVTRGDSFYVIARDRLGDAKRWSELFELNKDLVKGDPKKLRPGQVLRLPE
ncbi:MAG: LysM peptidoglycan-binding domain-containing protein [Phycisphaerae bacterium]